MQGLLKGRAVWGGGVSGSHPLTQHPDPSALLDLSLQVQGTAGTLCFQRSLHCICWQNLSAFLLPNSRIHWKCSQHRTHKCLVCQSARDSPPGQQMTWRKSFCRRALIKCKVLFCFVCFRVVFFFWFFFLARSTLRFRTYVTAHRWTWPSLGFFKCLNFPQNSHHPFHSCGYCSGCGGIKRGSSDRDCLGPGALGGIPESRASGRFSPGLPAAACVGEFREQRELLTQIIKARCFSSGARVGRVSPTGPAVFTE